MKILVVCQYYYPESFKVTDVCEALAENGHDVTVLTGKPNYPTGIVPKEYLGTEHDDEVINNVHVYRCYERGRGKGAINLAINYASFYFSAMKLVKKMDKDFDIVFSYQLSPIFMALPARWYKIKRHVPMFLYCSDLWPESLKVYLKGEANPIFKWVKKISRKVYDAADKIATQSDVFIDYLEEVHEVPADKLSYIPNFADESYLNEDFSTKDETIDFMFMGNIGVAQNVEEVTQCFIEAYKNLKDYSSNENDHVKPNIKLHIVGGGVKLDDVKKLVSDKCSENGFEKLKEDIVFYGQRPQEEMPKFYKMADVCIVSLKADSMIGLTLPAKVQGYMAAGKPILGMIDGSCQKVIEESKCGICVGSSDHDELVKAFEQMAMEKEALVEFGNNARDYFKLKFRKDIHVNAIEELLCSCIRG